MKQKQLNIYGYHVIHAALERFPECCQVLFVQEGKTGQSVDDLCALADAAGVSVQKSARSVLERLSEQGVHQGFVMQVRAPKVYSEAQLKDHAANILQANQHWPFYLFLEGVTDPHNFGACLRTAAAAGVAGVVVGRHDQARMTPVVLKASSGGAFSLPVYEVVNVNKAIQSLQALGFWAVATAMGDKAQNLYALDLSGPIICVMGAEGKGLKRLTLETCDFQAIIPMTSAVGSLNVSVAASVFIYESYRQRALR